MKILVNMAFDYGKQRFSSGEHECSDVNIIRHMTRSNYGKVIAPGFAKSEDTVKADEPKAKAPAKKRTKKTTKK